MAVDPVRLLKTHGRDLSRIPLSGIPVDMVKSALIYVDTHSSYRLNLGTIAINDSVSLTKVLKAHEFQVFFIHNATSADFLNYLDAILNNTSQQLVIFSVGHGVTDAAFVFQDGSISGDDFAKHITDNKVPECRVVLISDSCSPGSIWDLQGTEWSLPPGVVALSATTATGNISQTVATAQFDRLEQGVFTFNLTKLIKAEPEITPNELTAKMSAVLRLHRQTFVLGATSQDLLEQPLLR
jgi:hypothetical protein